MRVYPFVLIFALALPSFALGDTAKCRITGASERSVFSPFVGGKILIDLEDGSSTLVNGSSDFAVISSQQVSSFQVPRDRCTYGTEKIVRQDGSLRAMRFTFRNCARESSYVRAEVSFDLTSNTGLYQEILLTPTGEAPYAFVEIRDCAVVF